MLGRSHYAVGWAVWLAGNAAAGPPHPVPLIGGGLICSAAALLPDLDQPGSKAARSLGPVTGVLAHVVRWASGGHRHATHSLLAILATATAGVVLVAAAGWPWWAGVALPAGVAAHIAGDMLTRSGCPLAWPSRRPFWLSPRWLRFSTGHGGELVAVAVIVAVTAGCCWAGWVA